MAFQVTQCPSCESTFNTNPGLLDKAAGKVRCGACLTVFLAEENFIDTREDETGDETESVFIGGNPADFFDPSQFLTRSSLREEPFIEEPFNEEPLHEEPLNEEPFNEQPFNEERFNEKPLNQQPLESIDNAEESAGPFETMDTPAFESTDNGLQETRLSPTPDAALPPGRDEHIGEEFSSPDSTVPADRESENTQVGEDTVQAEFFSAIEESLSLDEESAELAELQAIAALDPQDDQELQNFDPFALEDGSIGSDLDAEEAARTEEGKTSEGGEESKTGEDIGGPGSAPSDAQETTVFLPVSPAPEPRTPRPEEFSISASFALQFRPAAKQENETRNQQDQHKETEPTEASTAHQNQAPQAPQSVDESLEELVRSAIEEQDFAAAVEAGLQEEPGQTAMNPLEPITSLDSDHDEHIEIFEIGEPDDPMEPAEQDGTGIGPEAHHPATVTDAETQQAISIGPAMDPDPVAEAQQEGIEEVDTSTAAIRQRALRQELEDDSALESIPQENLDTLKEIAPPVQLVHGKQSSLGKRIALLSAILLLGAMLAGQYLWRYRDSYSIDPRLRAAYQFVCTQIACELPEYVSIDAIRSDNLAVRSHPEREDGLMVTVEIRNTADFPQPFPILVLGFNSTTNQVIALREFSPEEYLNPGLREIDFMPVGSPVQLSIPIMDPGDDAVNYTLAFRAP